jgi:isopentenyl-diphosphate Delta-isomerase
MDSVILVDEQDNEVGSMEKLEAHRKGLLHRAFSVLLFNSKGEMLLQKRSANKYHSAGLWTNACCSHPRPGEQMEDAVRRRLLEEMGINIQAEYAYKFLYKVKLDDLTEYECDHVYVGEFDGEPSPNVNEVQSWKYANLTALKKDVLLNPDAYTYWFRLILDHPKINTLFPLRCVRKEALTG